MLPQAASDVIVRFVRGPIELAEAERPSESSEKEVCVGEMVKIGVGSRSCFEVVDDDEALTNVDGNMLGRNNFRGWSEPSPKR